MTETKQLQTENITVEIQQSKEKESITIYIRDTKTKEILQDYLVMDAKDLGRSWVYDIKHLKTYSKDC